MSKGRVLVIDDDEWVCRLLAVAMKEAGFEITITENAAEGFYKAVEEQPDCIVCDVDLPDHNGYWVAKKIRSHPSKIANAPLIFLSGLDDREHRLEGFQVGGDAYLTKPFRIDEVVAQVDALIQMAKRLKGARPSLTSIPPPGAAMTGDLAQMSVGTLLTLVDLERRSGKLLLRTGQKKAEFAIEAGNVIGATLDGANAPPLNAIRIAMHWVSGKFSFVPTETPAKLSEDSQPINALLMEAARLEDEARADEDRPSSAPLASWKESIARTTQRPNLTPHPPGLTPSAPPSEEGGSLSIFPSEPQPYSPPPVSSPDSRVPVSLQPMAPSDPPTVAEVSAPPFVAPTRTEPTPTTAVPPVVAKVEPKPVTPKPPVTYPVVPAPPATPQAPRAPAPKPTPAPAKPIPTTLTSMPAQRPPTSTTPAGGSPRPSPVAPRAPTPATPAPPAASPAKPPFAPRPTPSPFKATQPSGATKPPKPPLPKTGFAGAIRSLSPAQGMRAVTPPAGSPKPPPTAASNALKNLPPVPKQEPAAEEPKPASVAVPPASESLDSGWSNPPPAEDEEK